MGRPSTTGYKHSIQSSAPKRTQNGIGGSGIIPLKYSSLGDGRAASKKPELPHAAAIIGADSKKERPRNTGEFMEDSGSDSGRYSPDRTALPLILLAAVIQGWVLYWLHHSLKFHHWPSTDQAWLVPLYALALFVPVTVQLLARYAQAAILRRFIIALTLAFFYFGWHFGAHVSNGLSGHPQDWDSPLPLALLSGILWLLVLPFAQTRLTTGHWARDYGSLFTHAWHNKLMLAEAALFTGLFWLLLFLWQMLFHLLKIDYFRDLFEEPIFIYPVTALTFGCAMHLIGSITQLTSVVLEQLLNVLKWLATIAAVILALFTVALLS